MDDLDAWIRLTKTGASARRLNRLLDHFGSPAALFAASVEDLRRAEGCSREVAEKLLHPACAARDRDYRLMETLGVTLLPRSSPEYPALLQEIPDPPPALYVRGTLSPRDRRSVAIVGSRRATDYGRRLAERFARELVEAGLTVVSGLARGIDTAAHLGALRGGGRTLACLGCGVDIAYPPENRELAAQIAESGAVLSEYPMNAAPDAWHFPSRNRIVSGLSLGVVILEAPSGSGALITTECAVQQNREVFAVPGNVDNFRNAGAHALIKDGAKLVETVQDILCELPPETARGPLQPSLELDAPRALPELSPDETVVFGLLHEEPQPMDDLLLELELPTSRVSAALLTLEIKGLARRLPGNAYVRIL